MRARLYPALRGLFALAGLVFIGFALRDALRDPDLTLLPSAGGIALALLAVVVGLIAATIGWARLLGVQDPRVVARGFLLAQLGKYIPGGVWQVVGQVGDASRAASTGGRTATVAFVVSVATQVTAGLLVGLPLTFLDATPTWLRVGIVAGAVVSVGLLLQRRLLTWLLLSLPWLREAADETTMPTRNAMVVSTVTGMVSLVAAGLVFEIAYTAPEGTTAAVVIPAYALAWTIGFLAIPFPAGLGVREGALLLLLPDGASAAIVAASAVVRVVYIVGELLTLGLAQLPMARARTR